MKRMLWPVIAIAAACGGKAVLDGDGGGGAGASSSGPTTTVTVGPAPVAISSVTTGMTNLCMEACTAIASCLIGVDDCVSTCVQTPVECSGMRDEFLSCYLADHTPRLCTMRGECVDALVAFTTCEGSGLDSFGCSGGPNNSCACDGVAIDGTFHETSCETFGDTARCQCFENGQNIGECIHDEVVSDACDPYFGCCAGLFFIP